MQAGHIDDGWSDTSDTNPVTEPPRQIRSFVPSSPAPRRINRLGWTKTPGKIEAILSRFCAYRLRRAARSAVRTKADDRCGSANGCFWSSSPL